MIKEQDLIRNIVVSSDWEEIINQIVLEEEMDPWNIDIIKLTDAFVKYLERMKVFDFRIPARFILIAAILLRMKCELLSIEEAPEKVEGEDIPPFDIGDIPVLEAPIKRRPKRKVMLTELITALEKAFEFKERKERKKIRMRKAVEKLIEEEENIEEKINNIYEKIIKDAAEYRNCIPFSRIVGVWTRRNVVNTFMPLLHLSNRGSVHCEQEEMFREIFVSLKDN